MRIGAVLSRGRSARAEPHGTPLPSAAAQARAGTREACWQFYLDVADGLFSLGRPEEAMQYVLRTAELAGELGRRDPSVAKTLNALAVLHCRFHGYIAAERLLRRAAGIHKRAGRPKHPGPAGEYERALAIAESTHGPRSAEAAFALDLLAGVYVTLNRRSEALCALRRALEIKEALGPKNSSTAVTLGKLGEFHMADGRSEEAEPLLRRALSIKRKILGKGDPILVRDLKRLAYSCSAQRKFREAEPLFAAALVMVKRALGTKRPEIVRTLRDLAKTYREQERCSDTSRLLEVSIAILEKALGPDDPESQTALEFYSEILRALNLKPQPKISFTAETQRRGEDQSE